MLNDLERLDVADSILLAYNKEVLIYRNLLKVTQDKVTTLEYKNSLLMELQAITAKNDLSLYKQRLKDERRKRGKVTLIAIGQAVVIVLLII